MKKICKELLPYLIIILVVVLFRSFIATPVRVEGLSMYPNLNNNDILILNKMDHKYKRFDIVVVNYNGTRIVKRVVGFPGEKIEYKNSKLYVNGKEVKEKFLSRDIETEDFSTETFDSDTIPKGYYFVVGDNRSNSLDSRMIGLISEKDILGTTTFTIFPFQKFGKIKTS